MASKIVMQRRLHRMIRRQEKRGPVTLNIVSMIDVFTTLVFFLLITTTSVQALRNPKALSLPNSLSQQQPTDTPLLMVSRTDITLQGRFVMSVDDAQRGGTTLAPLRLALLQADLQQVAGKAGAQTRGEINIMADRDTSYALLKKVMDTCGEAQFARISLSVNHHGKVITQ